MSPPFAYKTVTGKYLAPDGTAVAGSIRFIPSTTVYDSTGNVVVPALPILVALDGAGAFSVPLLVTDDPATNPVGWVWRVSELFSPQRDWEFQLPSASPSTVHMADLSPATSVDATWAYATLAAAAALDARVTAAEATATAAATSATASAAAAAASAASAVLADNLTFYLAMGAI